VDRVACSGKAARADLFREAGAKARLNPVIVEKDFWVCWLLKRLFSTQEFDGWLTFKGGTSLSKCFDLIQRFSEDIDIAVDFERLGFTGDKDPRQERLSRTKRTSLLEAMMLECRRYISGPFSTALTERVREVLGPGGWSLTLGADDPNTVEFVYPSALETGLDYIKPKVVLELGTHAEPIPHGSYPVRPFAAEHFPQAFSEAAFSVKTVVARRTFWEKATILHAEHHRPADKPMPPRYSRHYADVAMMSRKSVAKEAFADLDLLRAVALHKDRFYHCGWARIFDAKPGDFRLLPPEGRLQELQRDYRGMEAMFFGEPPTMERILKDLADLEKRIND